MPPQEPPTDSFNPTGQDEEIVDPSIPQGNAKEVIIRRHPFGIVAMYLQAIIGLGVALGLVYFIIPSLLSDESRVRAISYLSVFAVVAVALTAFFLLVATAIYHQNKWVITDDSITQFTQIGLFRRQSSQLSMANIEDVTSEQLGILAELFGFGTLKVETAGEHSNFHFPYCPQPSKYSQIILDARERYISERPEEANKTNEVLNTRGEFPH